LARDDCRRIVVNFPSPEVKKQPLDTSPPSSARPIGAVSGRLGRTDRRPHQRSLEPEPPFLITLTCQFIPLCSAAGALSFYNSYSLPRTDVFEHLTSGKRPIRLPKLLCCLVSAASTTPPLCSKESPVFFADVHYLFANGSSFSRHPSQIL